MTPKKNPSPTAVAETTIAALELIPADVNLRDILRHVRDVTIELLSLRVPSGPADIAQLAMERYEKLTKPLLR